MNNFYQLNDTTHKLELYLEKSYYLALPNEMKRNIKSTFSYDCKRNLWESKANLPNLYSAEIVIHRLQIPNKNWCKQMTLNETEAVAIL